MRYLPHTAEEIDAMLATIGASSLDDLFTPVPADCRMTSPWDLPEPKSEWALYDHFLALADAMAVNEHAKVLVGAGSYPHHIPETIRTLAPSRAQDGEGHPFLARLLG